MQSRNKYHNRKAVVNGELFDSRKEARRWLELKSLEKIKAISDLQRQVKYVLIPVQREDGKVIERECSYYADFVYHQNGKLIVEDAKGMKTPEYIIKRKLMLSVHGIRIKEV